MSQESLSFEDRDRANATHHWDQVHASYAAGLRKLAKSKTFTRKQRREYERRAEAMDAKGAGRPRWNS